MKYLIILLLVLIIFLFIHKLQIEETEHLVINTSCPMNCGDNTLEKCLDCPNCGICTLNNKGKETKFCTTGNENGAYFNIGCKGKNWEYKGAVTDKQKTTIIKTSEREPNTEPNYINPLVNDNLVDSQSSFDIVNEQINEINEDTYNKMVRDLGQTYNLPTYIKPRKVVEEQQQIKEEITSETTSNTQQPTYKQPENYQDILDTLAKLQQLLK